jgi:hypothetical protein
MTDLSHITDETMKEWGGLSASLLSAPSKRDLTVSERLSKTTVVDDEALTIARAAAALGDE